MGQQHERLLLYSSGNAETIGDTSWTTSVRDLDGTATKGKSSLGMTDLSNKKPLIYDMGAGKMA